MSKGGKSGRGVFDVERISQIVELMEQHDLSEVDLQQGDDKIRLKRGGDPVPVMQTPIQAPVQQPVQQAGNPAGGASAGSVDDGTITINAPMVGTFYSKANPDAEPFAQVGTVVTDDTIVCIVEAMKVFNEIPAECRGTIVEVLVDDQQAVDFGKPMFRVKPNA